MICPNMATMLCYLTTDAALEHYELQFAAIFDQIVAYAQGTPNNVVNPEVLACSALRKG